MSRRFAIIPARALDDERLTHIDLRVLCAYGRETDKHGWCKVYQSTIAASCRVSREYVNKRTKHLTACGYIEQQHQNLKGRGRGASLYRLLFDVIIPDADSEIIPDEPDVPVVHKETQVNTQFTGLVNTEFTAKDTIRSSLPKVVVEGARESSILDRLSDGLKSVTGNAVDWNSPGIAVLSIPLGWINSEKPFDLDLDILPTVRAICQTRQGSPPIRSWNYFRAAIAQNRDSRLAPTPDPKARHDRTNTNKSRNEQKTNSLIQSAIRASAGVGSNPNNEVHQEWSGSNASRLEGPSG